MYKVGKTPPKQGDEKKGKKGDKPSGKADKKTDKKESKDDKKVEKKEAVEA